MHFKNHGDLPTARPPHPRTEDNRNLDLPPPFLPTPSLVSRTWTQQRVHVVPQNAESILAHLFAILTVTSDGESSDHQTPLMSSRAPVLGWLGWDDVGPLQAFWLFGESVIPLLLLSLRVFGLGTMYREPSKLAVEVTSVQCELCALVVPVQRPAQRYF